MHDEQPLLIIFASGLVLAPGTTTYGELLERFKFAAELAVSAERKMRATPLEDTNNATA